jgi:arginase
LILMSKDLKVAINKFPFSGQFGLPELGVQAEAIEKGGLPDLLEKLGCEVAENYTAKLTVDDTKQYGAQNRMALANRNLAQKVSAQIKSGVMPLGLLQNCNGLMGMLAGVQHSGGWAPLRVGLVWVDAHGDFNTPETSLSGMLGGMPVAISCGLCLDRLRRTCSLDPPLPTRYVTMACIRDTDPLEQELLDRSDIEYITTEDVKKLTPQVSKQIERLASLTDLIYVHIDLDVLDPADIPGAGLPVANGPTAKELSASLEVMFRHPKTVAFGVASYPAARDTEKVGLKSTLKLFEGVIKGVKSRKA